MPARTASTECVGVVVALAAEARSLGAYGMHAGDCQRWRNGWLTVAGVGPHCAMRATERLLACGVTSLENWGVAGALDARLAPGDIVIPERIRCTDDDVRDFVPDTTTSANLAQRLAGTLPVHRGVLWSAAHAVATVADKRALATRTGAGAVDMEAASVAAVAARAHLPFVALKAICDPATRELPPRIVRALDGGGVSAGMLMLAAIVGGGPATWRAARALAHDFARARRALATAARLTAPPT